MSSYARAGENEELLKTMIAIAKEADEPLEPWELVNAALEETELNVTEKDARQALRTLTHGKRSERDLVHALDGRIEAAE